MGASREPRQPYPKGIERRFSDLGLNFKTIVSKYYNAVYRCSCSKAKLYKSYGGRGIKVEMSRDEFLEWFLQKYPAFEEKFGKVTTSIGRIHNDKNYTLDNLEIITVSDNSAEAYFRRGNPSPHGNKLDDMICLTIYTLVKEKRKELEYYYEVSPSTIRQVKLGTVRKDLHRLVYGW